MRIRQRAAFKIESAVVTPSEITARLGVRPDRTMARGERHQDPPRPLMHKWEIVCSDGGLTVDAQVGRVAERLLPIEPALVRLVADIGSESHTLGPDVKVRGGCVLSVVRYFDDQEGEEEDDGRLAGSDLVRLPGQHQLLGWHLDADVLNFLVRVGAVLDVDEYG